MKELLGLISLLVECVADERMSDGIEWRLDGMCRFWRVRGVSS